MRLNEVRSLYEDNEKAEIKQVVQQSDNTSLLMKVAAYLKNKLAAQDDEQPVNESDINDVKSAIMQMLDQVNDADELHKILSVMRRDEVYSGVKEIFDAKGIGYGKKNDEHIAALILATNSTFEEKMQFIERAKVGYFDGADILKNKQGNLIGIIKNQDNVLKQIIGPLSKFGGKIGYPGDTGPAEMAMLILGKDVGFPQKGDLLIASTEVEVKATQKGNKGKVAGGRPKGRNGWNSPTTVREWFFDSLAEKGATEEELSQPLNLNPTGIENLSNILTRVSDKKESSAFIKEMLQRLYSDADDDMINLISPSIMDDGGIDVATFIKQWAKIQHAYYAQQEGHDVMMIINTDSLNYVLVQDTSDIDKHEGVLKFASHPSWNDNQSMGTMQFIVR